MWRAGSIFVFFIVISQVQGHGRLIDPPGRSSMWRFGYNTPANQGDNELWCGRVMTGACGVCGDPPGMKPPRPNEAGGKYALGIITRNYTKNSVITVTVDLTANHGGHFEFKICPNNDVKKIVEQECLDKYPLEMADGTGSKIRIGGRGGKIKFDLNLPKDLTCTQCVLQWHYRAANNWGICPGEGGKGRRGCGPQEIFRGCADVSIQ